MRRILPLVLLLVFAAVALAQQPVTVHGRWREDGNCGRDKSGADAAGARFRQWRSKSLRSLSNNGGFPVNLVTAVVQKHAAVSSGSVSSLTNAHLLQCDGW